MYFENGAGILSMHLLILLNFFPNREFSVGSSKDHTASPKVCGGKRPDKLVITLLSKIDFTCNSPHALLILSCSCSALSIRAFTIEHFTEYLWEMIYKRIAQTICYDSSYIFY